MDGKIKKEERDELNRADCRESQGEEKDENGKDCVGSWKYEDSSTCEEAIFQINFK